MATSTTSSVWRSTGGDQTRTATAGSMVMITPFYIANAAATANVTTVSGGQPVILPAGAIVTDVIISSTGANTIDMGFTPLTGGVGPGQTTTLGSNVRTGLFSGRSIAARGAVAVGGTGAGASLGNVANATNLVVVTAQSNASASGTVNGLIQYVVYDTGAQNV